MGESGKEKRRRGREKGRKEDFSLIVTLPRYRNNGFFFA